LITFSFYTPCSFFSSPSIFYFKNKTMNQLKFYGKLLCAATVFFLMSCGNGEDKTTTETTGADTTAATATPAVVNTIVTTPEHMMIVRNKVSDYDKWLLGFESHDSLKLANGLHNYVVGRSTEDSNVLLVATKADDMAKAKAFGKAPELKQAMQKDGVTGKPVINYVTTVYQDTAKISTDIRAMTMVTVKDWDAWKTSFESHRQDRLDAGLIDRVYGYDPDDNHKVTIVVAVTDTARANAFWNSPDLKQKMTDAGVVGKPERFMFRVTKRY
jgi:hypothetical protein